MQQQRADWNKYAKRIVALQAQRAVAFQRTTQINSQLAQAVRGFQAQVAMHKRDSAKFKRKLLIPPLVDLEAEKERVRNAIVSALRND